MPRIKHENAFWEVTSDLAKTLQMQSQSQLETAFQMFTPQPDNQPYQSPDLDEALQHANRAASVFFYFSSCRHNWNAFSDDILTKPDADTAIDVLQNYKDYCIATFRDKTVRKTRDNAVAMCDFYIEQFKSQTPYLDKLPAEIAPR